MHPDYRIREALPGDLGVLGDIERIAARQFRAHGIDGDFLDEATSLEDLSAAHADGRLWVAAQGDRCVGFAIAARLDDGESWLHEIDVHPDHGRRGLGRALVETVIAWARRNGSRSLSLSTFRDVAWNAPFYASVGFRELSPERYTDAIRAIVEDEKGRDLPMDRRLVMRLELAQDGTRG
jgi:GNAT superfamily N-acetyltransferase